MSLEKLKIENRESDTPEKEKRSEKARSALAISERWDRLDSKKRERFYSEWLEATEKAGAWECFRKIGLRFQDPLDPIECVGKNNPRIITDPKLTQKSAHGEYFPGISSQH